MAVVLPASLNLIPASEVSGSEKLHFNCFSFLFNSHFSLRSLSGSGGDISILFSGFAEDFEELL
jgi:hypothetical protein